MEKVASAAGIIRVPPRVDRNLSRALSMLTERMATLKQTRRRGRARHPSLARFVKQARKLGLAVSGATLATDGSVSLTFGKPEANNAVEDNEWDQEYGPH